MARALWIVCVVLGAACAAVGSGLGMVFLAAFLVWWCPVVGGGYILLVLIAALSAEHWVYKRTNEE